MNQTITYFKTILPLVCLSIIQINCTPESDFTIPPIQVQKPTIQGIKIDIQAVLGIMYQEIEKNGEGTNASFNDTNNYIEGYVVSNDKGGNFFKEIIFQNQPQDPTAGIRVLINNSPLYTSYEFGRKVYIKLDGLSVGIKNGVPTLGIVSQNTIEAIPSFSVNEFITRSPEVFAITPLDIKIKDFADHFLNLYVKINTVQFTKSTVLDNNIFTLAAEPNDGFNGERILESCESGQTAIVSTSSFADFKAVPLSKQQGSFTGILTKNFLGNMFNLVLNDHKGLDFDIETRCDPVFLSCSDQAKGNNILFQEGFNGYTTKDLEKSNWINTNILGGSLNYEIGDFAENQFIEITGFRSKEPIYEVWLLSPEIDLSNTTGAELNFDVQSGFDNGNILDVFVSSNFNGVIKESTWTKIDAHIPRGTLTSFGNFVPAGPINLSCINDKIRIGFRYTGGDPRATTRYHIDNISIKGN